MPVIDLLMTTGNGQENIGSIVLDESGKLSVQSKDTPLDDILNEPNRLRDGSLVWAKDSPEKWFGALPRKYNGTYLRAQMRPDRKTTIEKMRNAASH